MAHNHDMAKLVRAAGWHMRRGRPSRGRLRTWPIAAAEAPATHRRSATAPPPT